MGAELAKKRGRPRKVDVEASTMSTASGTLTSAAKMTSASGKKASYTKDNSLEATTADSKKTMATPVVRKSISMPSAQSSAASAITDMRQTGILRTLEEQGVSRPFTAPKAVKLASQSASTAPIAKVGLPQNSSPASQNAGKTVTPSLSEAIGTAVESKVDASSKRTTSAGQGMYSTPIRPPTQGVSTPPAPFLSQGFSPTAALLKEKSPSKSSTLKAGSSPSTKTQPTSTSGTTNPAASRAPQAPKTSPIRVPREPPPSPSKETAKPVNASQPPKKPSIASSPPNVSVKPIKVAGSTRRDPMRPTNPSAPLAAPSVGSEIPVKKKGFPGTYKQAARRQVCSSVLYECKADLNRITLIMVALPVAIVTSYHLYERCMCPSSLL